jgi:hypothetical protein
MLPYMMGEVCVELNSAKAVDEAPLVDWVSPEACAWAAMVVEEEASANKGRASVDTSCSAATVLVESDDLV